MNNQLTRNFNKREFNSKDGKRMPIDVFLNIQVLAQQLQVIRDTINSPLNINSAYRSPEHNKRIGGVPNSQHLLGNAADITSRDFTPTQLYSIIEGLIEQGKILQGGLGLYNGFVHYDIRGKNPKTGKGYRWDYRK